MSHSVFMIGINGAQHTACGVLRGFDDAPGFSCGLDYGGPYSFDTDGKFGNLSGGIMALFPITAESARTFSVLMGQLRKIDENRRLPFYFSRTNEVNLLLESGPDYLNPDGSIHKLKGEYGGRMRQEFMIGATGKTIRDPAVIHQDGLARVRANCVTMTKLVTALCGIDLARLGPEARTMTRGNQASTLLWNLFARTDGGPAPDRGVAVRPLSLANDCNLLLVKAGAKRDLRFNALLAEAVAAYPSYRALHDSIAGHAPLSMEPLAPPPYLQAELDRLAVAQTPAPAPIDPTSYDLTAA